MCKSEMKEKHCVFGLLAGALLSVSCALLPSVSSGMEKESQAQRDFGRARWMWPHELGCATNTVVEFRTGFSVASPQSLRLAIAADTVYSVSLNGSEPLTGRFPNVPPVEFYDVLDIGECRAGENSLTVKLYVQGIDSFQYMPGRQGVMFSLAGNGVKVNSGMDVQWRLSRCDRSEGVVISTPQLGFSFEYDANAPVDAWKTICAEDLGPSAKALNLIRRPVPPCVTLPEVRERIVAQGRLDGSQVNAHPAKGMDATAMTFVRQEDFFEDDCRTVRQKWFNDGFYVIVDLGREEAGLLSFDIETDAGTVIDVGHAEHMEDGCIKVALRSYFFAGRYRAAEGVNRYCRWARRMAGRYIQLHVRGVKTRFRLNRLSVKPVEFPVKELPHPAFAKGDVADIWRTCVRTLRLCMHEHYEDCPWREQAMYANDSRNQMLAGYFAFDRGNKMPEMCLRLLSRGIGDDGWISLCVPSRIGRPIPSFTFSWVLSVEDYLRYRGDVGLVRELMPHVTSVLDRRIAELKDGLLPCPKAPRRYWQFYDWAKDLDNEGLQDWEGDRYDAPLNLFCLLALQAGVRCADAAGESAGAARWRVAAENMRSAIRAGFWNDRECRVETAMGRSLAPSELVQSLALLAGVIPDGRRRSVVAKLSSPSDWTETTLSQSIYKYEALLAEGGGVSASAVRSMTETWKSMLDSGATSFWEMKEGWRAFGGLASLCHGWSAIPIYIYSKAR